MPMNDRISAEALRAFTTAVFETKGLASADAERIAQTLVWADLRSIGTHGVSRIPLYCHYIDQGDLDPRGIPVRLADQAAVAHLHARQAAGPVSMAQGVALALDKADASGAGVVLVSHTTHVGALGYYTQAMAKQGYTGIALAATVPLMAYHGSFIAAAGTNPLSIAVPVSHGNPVLLDITPSASSWGEIMAARRSGTPLPDGVAADAHGHVTTDARRARVTLPLGGPKGSGLSFMIELLTSHLANNPLISSALAGQLPGHSQNALLLAINTRSFIDPETLAASVRRFAAQLHALPPLDPAAPVRLPGERGDASHAQRERDGIPLDPAVRAELTQLARSLGLDFSAYYS